MAWSMVWSFIWCGTSTAGWGTVASRLRDAGLIAKDVKDAVDNEDKGETTTNAC